MKEGRGQPLGEVIVSQQGPLVRRRVYYSGHTHWGGVNVEGYTGPEHYVEQTVLIPNRIVNVKKEG